MAVQEQVDRLKRSVDEWNQWRRQYLDLEPNLNGTDLHGVYLHGVYLSDANLGEANLSEANLSEAHLSRTNLSKANLNDTNLGRVSLSKANLSEAYLCRAYLRDANLSGADLGKANLTRANLTRADLSGANLTRANLSGANLGNVNLGEATLNGVNLSNADLTRANLSNANLASANLSGANLTGADLSEVNLSEANLSEANFARAKLSRTCLDQANLTKTRFWDTFFAWMDLSNIKGLDTAIHEGPSTVNINSVIFPLNQDTRQHFLRGTGFPDIFIDYLPSLLTTPIQYYSLFIGYAGPDEPLARQLYKDLQDKGVRCWFAPHDLRPGGYFREGIDQAIQSHEKVLLLLSEHSVKSGWVRYEVESALARENHQQREILFPLRLDDTVLHSSANWAALLRATRHIGDFTCWRNTDTYQQAFAAMLRHLKVTKSLIL